MSKNKIRSYIFVSICSLFFILFSTWQLGINKDVSIVENFNELHFGNICMYLQNQYPLCFNSYVVKWFNNSSIYTNLSLADVEILFGLSSGLIFMFFNLLMLYIIRQKHLVSYRTLYLDENIYYSYNPLLWLSSFCQFFIGLFFGIFILPFFIFNNISVIRMVNLDNFWIYVFILIIAFLMSMILGDVTIVLTQKRFKHLVSFGFMFKGSEIMLSDIKNVKFEKNRICLYKSEDEFFPLPFRKGVKCYEVYKKIKEGVFEDVR